MERHSVGEGNDQAEDHPLQRVAAEVAVSILWGAENAVTSRDLRILVEEAAKPIASLNEGVVVGGRGEGPSVRRFLAECPVRPVGVVVIDVFAEDVVEMSSADDEHSPAAPVQAW